MSDQPSLDDLMSTYMDAASKVKAKLEEMSTNSGPISVDEMFEMQMRMNQLAQLSEVSAWVISATNSVISSMARNVKS